MNNEQYEAEAYQRWGKSDAYKESMRRKNKYSKADIDRASAEMHEATAIVREALLTGLPATSDLAKSGAEAHRASISKWWYECSFEMHKNLGDMYVADSRFAEHYESQAIGLAKFMRDAIFANAASAR